MAASAILAVAFYLLLCRWFRQSHHEHAVLNDEHIEVDLVLALWASRRRAPVEVLVVKGVEVKIDRSAKPVLIEVPALWALDCYLFWW